MRPPLKLVSSVISLFGQAVERSGPPAKVETGSISPAATNSR